MFFPFLTNIQPFLKALHAGFWAQRHTSLVFDPRTIHLCRDLLILHEDGFVPLSFTNLKLQGVALSAEQREWRVKTGFGNAFLPVWCQPMRPMLSWCASSHSVSHSSVCPANRGGQAFSWLVCAAIFRAVFSDTAGQKLNYTRIRTFRKHRITIDCSAQI